MITLRWAQFPGSVVTGFKIYRSIVGFVAPSNVSLNGLNLILKMNGGSAQIIPFGSGNPVDDINAVLLGGRAYPAVGNFFLVRSDIRDTPGSVEIVGGTALSVLGLTPHVITAKSEAMVLATVPPASDPTAVLEYQDPDGALLDYYAISTLDIAGVESQLSAWIQPVAAAAPLCVVEGIVIDLQGVRVVDAEVKATIENPAQFIGASHITTDTMTTYTGTDGRFSLAILQGALVKLEIPAIGYCYMVTIPAQTSVFLKDLAVDTDYRYPTEFEAN